MILTVTPDPVLDKILFVKRWTPDTPMHAEKTALGVGGKGLDASLVLQQLGVETVGLTFLAGPTGESLLELAGEHQLTVEPVWAGGETRTAYIVAQTEPGHHSHIFVGGLEIDEAQRTAFLDRLTTYLADADWLICGGIIPDVLPTDFYRRVTERAHAAGVPVLIDSFRSFITDALPSQPDILKMNCQEFEWTFGGRADDLETLKEEAVRIRREQELGTLVITCGPDGLLAVSDEGVVHAQPPRLKALNATGAGDAASAVLAWRLSSGDAFPEALRRAAAVSAAVVLTESTAICRAEDVERIYPEVVVKTW
jgi:1-phosphofructokinase family hexose kinase